MALKVAHEKPLFFLCNTWPRYKLLKITCIADTVRTEKCAAVQSQVEGVATPGRDSVRKGQEHFEFFATRPWPFEGPIRRESLGLFL